MNPQLLILSDTARTLWPLGYPEQSRRRSHEALQLARERAHPYSLAHALYITAWLHPECGEGVLAQEHAEAAEAVCREHGFPWYLAAGTIQRGRALIVQKQWVEGIAHIRQGLAALAGEAWRTVFLAWLAEGYRGAGQAEDGLVAIAEALRLVEKHDERYYEAEVYRIKGELLLNDELEMQNDERQTKEEQLETTPIHRSSFCIPHSEQAETCFLKAIAVSQKQHAKSLELRAVMSLARLWQRQGKQHEACNMLSEVYHWFTEGFDTADLKDAKEILEELT